jgi:F-type H+-transporting ATPase subunit b
VNINLTLIGQMITFIIFVWFTLRYVWPPITKALDERQQRIAEGLSAAERGLHELEKAKVQIAEMMATAKADAQSIIAEANRRSLEAVDEAKAKAQTEGERIIHNAQNEIERLLLAAKEQIRKDMVKIAIRSAEKILAREIDIASNDSLLQQLVKEL